MPDPLAYFITFTTYGTWLHGRAPGSVDRQHNASGTPFRLADTELEASRQRALRQEPYLLDDARRGVVLRTIREVAEHRKWKLLAAHVRTNHVHVIITAADKPEKVMGDLKAWASRRLREVFSEDADRDRWTQHGSTRYLNTHAEVDAAIFYVVKGQGKAMEFYQYEPEASATDWAQL